MVPARLWPSDARAGLIGKLPAAAYVLADAAYDIDKFQQFLAEHGSIAVIKPNPTLKKSPPFNAKLLKARNVIERAFAYPKYW